MWFLKGVVASLVSPLGTALMLWLASALVLMVAPARKRSLRRLGGVCGVVALAWLWLWSTPVASHALRSRIEAQAGPNTVAQVTPAALAVVLGGGVGGARPEGRPYPDLESAADRVWHAARLYRARKARLIVLSGGSVRPEEGAEALAMQVLLRDLGVPETATLLEARSTTTAENARFTAQRLQQRGVTTIILVTSALHMRRARAEFERAGLTVNSAPTDFESLGRRCVARDWLPNSEALDGSARAFKELVGYWAASLKE